MEAAAAANFSPTIRPIHKGVVHKICAGQVILDLSSAVKELVENSLDAGATSIEISLKEHGEEWFQVIDNGCGISPSNFKVLALKHHTSKLADFSDLQSLITFGFRGEALSSLCTLGDLTIETRTKNESVATHLNFDHSGLLTAEKKTARQVGTTVTVKKLFSNYPVRSKEFSRNIRKEYGKLISLLNAYALIAKGVRLVCTNITGKSAKSVVLKTQGTDSLKDNIITVFGMKTFSCLEPFNIHISESCRVDGFLSKPGQGSGRNLGDRQYFFVNGRPVDIPKVSKLLNELYKGANSRQYPIAIMNFTVPTRACDVNVTPDKRKIFFADENSILLALRDGLQKIYSPSNVSYAINKIELIKPADDTSCFNQEKSQTLLKQLSTEGGDCEEINMEAHVADASVPFKTVKTISHDGERLVQKYGEKFPMKDLTLRVHGLKKAESFPKSDSGQVATHLNCATDENAPSPSRVIDEGVAGNRDSNSSLCSLQSTLDKFVNVNKRKYEETTAKLSEFPVLRNQAPQCPLKKSNYEIHGACTSSRVTNQIDDSVEVSETDTCKDLKTSMIFSKLRSLSSSSGTTHDGKIVEDPAEASPLPDISSGSPPSRDLEEMSGDLKDATPPSRSSSSVSDSSTCFTLQFNFQELKTRRQQRLSKLQCTSYTSEGTDMRSHQNYAAASLELSQPDNEERKARVLDAATTELERLFNKKDFGRMKVIGQFNLGFIIGKVDQDLFIVDQHAADEKYNFERLCQSTILNQQPLLRSLRLELSPEEEVVASMNMEIIRKNGFTLEEDSHAPPGYRFRLTAVPFSKNITFGIEDVKDLISTLSDSQGECSIISSYKMDTPASVCPSRVRAMLASRACRSSVMIGDPLGRNEMQKILENLAGLKSPWNCPHGRPTMRHLVDMTSIYKKADANHGSLMDLP